MTDQAIELRIKNDPSEIRRQQYQVAAERFGWNAKYHSPASSEGPVKSGIGCAGATWGGAGRGSEAEVRINPDGTVEVRCGTQDLGTGTKTLASGMSDPMGPNWRSATARLRINPIAARGRWKEGLSSRGVGTLVRRALTRIVS